MDYSKKLPQKTAKLWVGQDYWTSFRVAVYFVFVQKRVTLEIKEQFSKVHFTGVALAPVFHWLITVQGVRGSAKLYVT